MTRRPVFAGPANLPAALRPALCELLLHMADEELTIGHRASEWTGFGPHIEEDVAMSSIAQDELGHALTYLRLLADLGAASPDQLVYSPDYLAYTRPAGNRLSATLLEHPRSDWAYSIVRHYFYDLYDHLRGAALQLSAYVPLAQAVAKIRHEERYHLAHFDTWFRRLCTTPAGHRHMQAALDRVWPEVEGLFEELEHGAALAAHGLYPAVQAELRAQWLGHVVPLCAALELRIDVRQGPGGPDLGASAGGDGGRRGRHGADLDQLLDDLTAVYRLDPAASW